MQSMGTIKRKINEFLTKQYKDGRGYYVDFEKIINKPIIFKTEDRSGYFEAVITDYEVLDDDCAESSKFIVKIVDITNSHIATNWYDYEKYEILSILEDAPLTEVQNGSGVSNTNQYLSNINPNIFPFPNIKSIEEAQRKMLNDKASAAAKSVWDKYEKFDSRYWGGDHGSKSPEEFIAEGYLEKPSNIVKSPDIKIVDLYEGCYKLDQCDV